MAVPGGQKHGRGAAVVLGIDEGPQLDEGEDGVVVAANGEPVQRRPAVRLVAAVGVCAVLNNEFREAGGRGALGGPAGGKEALLKKLRRIKKSLPGTISLYYSKKRGERYSHSEETGGRLTWLNWVGCGLSLPGWIIKGGKGVCA